MSRIVLSSIAVLTVASSVDAALVTFDAASDYVTAVAGQTFNTSHNTTTHAFSHGSSAGIGGSGGIAVAATGSGQSADSTAHYVGETYNLASGHSFTISAFFRATGQVLTAGTTTRVVPLQIGFTEANNTGFISSGNRDFISVRVTDVGNDSKSYYLVGQTAVNGAVAEVNGTEGFSLLDGNWYKLSATFQLASTAFSYSAKLENYGLSGTGTPSLVSSTSGTQNVDVMELSTAAYAAFRSRNQDISSVAAIDNFSVIPEPAALGLLAAASILNLRRRRRAE